MYDLHVPTAAYDKQVQQQKSLIALEDDKEVVCVSARCFVITR